MLYSQCLPSRCIVHVKINTTKTLIVYREDTRSDRQALDNYLLELVFRSTDRQVVLRRDKFLC